MRQCSTVCSCAKDLPLQGGDNLGQVSEFLRAADGAVKIEDVLPLFPDFARIDAFKGASSLRICRPSQFIWTRLIEHPARVLQEQCLGSSRIVVLLCRRTV